MRFLVVIHTSSRKATPPPSTFLLIIHYAYYHHSKLQSTVRASKSVDNEANTGKDKDKVAPVVRHHIIGHGGKTPRILRWSVSFKVWPVNRRCNNSSQ
jgi:hypothetical protein